MSACKVCPTARLERLLLATDGSEFSEGAVREAVNLAKTCGSKLFVVSVIEFNPELEEFAPRLATKIEEETMQQLEAIKLRAAKEGVDCEAISHKAEDPYPDIVEDASKEHADMIIMGRRGRTGLKRLMLGSVAAKVIGHAPCNVLIVPRAARVECRNILIATDGSKYSEKAVLEAVGIAKRSGATLIGISVAHNDVGLNEAEEHVRPVKEIAEKEGLKVEALSLKGIPYEVIVNTAKQRNADIIVVGSHGRTGMERLLMGSVTERVIGFAECAVLVVKMR